MENGSFTPAVGYYIKSLWDDGTLDKPGCRFLGVEIKIVYTDKKEHSFTYLARE